MGIGKKSIALPFRMRLLALGMGVYQTSPEARKSPDNKLLHHIYNIKLTFVRTSADV